MEKTQKKYQAQLSKCFQMPQLIKFINNQIAELAYPLTKLKCLTSKFAILNFKVQNTTSTYSFMTDHESIEFMFVLSKNYPLVAPRVHVKSNLLRPGINDCRDLLGNIIDLQTQPWSYKFTLKKLQEYTIKFLQKLQKDKDIYYIARIGNFQLNSVYPLEVIQQLRADNLFFAFQLFGQGQFQFKMVLLDVSPTHLAVFITKQQPSFNGQKFQIPQQKSIDRCMLSFYAQLGSLSEIYVQRSNFSDIQLVFTSQKPHNLSLQACKKTKKFKIKNGLQFIRKLVKNRKYYQISQIKLNLCIDSIQNQQKNILEQIAKAQQLIEHHLNLQTIKKLADSYQAAVQYYSTLSIPYYQIYLQYITKLYQREDVKTIMGTNFVQKKSSK